MVPLVVATLAACASAPVEQGSALQTLERYVKALERGDYPGAAELLVDDGRFGRDRAAIAQRLEAGGPAVLEEARALLEAARAPDGVQVEEVRDAGGGREVRTRR